MNVIRDPNAIKAKIGRLGLQGKKIDLGQITNEEIVSDTLLVKNLGESPINILFGEYSNYMSWTAEPETLQPGEFGKLALSYNAKLASRYGYRRDRIPLKIQDNVEVSSVLIVESVIVDDYSELSKVDSSMAPRCYFPKNIYSMGDVEAGANEILEIEFKNEGKRDLITHQVESARDIKVIGFDALVEPGKTGKITLKITLPKGKYYRGSVSIYNNDPTTDIQTVTVMGNIVD